MAQNKKYNMRFVSRKVGLSSHVIRKWEERYEAINPIRAESKHRLYSEDDVLRLSLLKELSDHGQRISHIAGLTNDELKARLKQIQDFEWSGSDVHEAKIDMAQSVIKNCIRAVIKMNMNELKNQLSRASINFTQRDLIEYVISPLITSIGDGWREGDIKIAAEHLATPIIRTFLNQLREQSSISEAAPGLVIATPAGQIHEMGSLLVAVVATQEEWNVNYCGPDLPADEIATILYQCEARALAISLVYPENDSGIHKEIKKIGDLVSSDKEIFAGGHSAPSYQSTLESIGAKIVMDFNQFRKELKRLKSYTS